jgi:yecA family protein
VPRVAVVRVEGEARACISRRTANGLRRMFGSSRSHSRLHLSKPVLLPPKLSELGPQPFTAIERESLARLMREPAWPRGTLNIYGLEGYLTALLVWPVALQAGAWLPPIWNEQSWRVRPPIDTEDRYGEFLELVVGFLRTIDQGLLQSPRVFDHCLHVEADADLSARAHSWVEGFGRGLRQSAQARVSPDERTREAIGHIASLAEASRDTAQRAHIVLTEAVLALASTRASRGPLGALPKRVVVPNADQSAPAATAAPLSDASV